jgi:transcriptional regulator with XRE-family HTH domain
VTAISPAATALLRLAGDTDTLFGQRMRAVRQARGLSSEALARRLGQHVQFVVAIERGHSQSRKRRRVSVGEGLAICAVLGVDLAQMLDPDVLVETLTGDAA